MHSAGPPGIAPIGPQRSTSRLQTQDIRTLAKWPTIYDQAVQQFKKPLPS